MVNANELRIGNHFIRELKSSRGLEYDHDFILDESAMGKLFGDSIALALQDLFPIPLTPEILEAAGFEGDDSLNVFTLGEWIVDFSIHDGVISYEGKRLFDEDIKKTFPLHRLQNLVFAISGTELVVDLKEKV